jgi:hypothetical protein
MRETVTSCSKRIHPRHQRIVVPDHRSLRLGTLSAILRVVAAHKRIDKDRIAALL